MEWRISRVISIFPMAGFAASNAFHANPILQRFSAHPEAADLKTFLCLEEAIHYLTANPGCRFRTDGRRPWVFTKSLQAFKCFESGIETWGS